MTLTAREHLEEQSAGGMSVGSAIIVKQSPGGKYDADVSAVSSTENEGSETCLFATCLYWRVLFCGSLGAGCESERILP